MTKSVTYAAAAMLIALGAAGLASRLLAARHADGDAAAVAPAVMDDCAADIDAPAQIRTLLFRACYDCHSNVTRWPWYSRLPPASWLIVRDVTLGRRELNFSRWRSYYPLTRRRKLKWMGRMLREGAMPPWSYRLMHPAARLSGAERAMLDRWVDAQLSASTPQGANGESGRPSATLVR